MAPNFCCPAESKGFTKTVEKSLKVDLNENATVNLTMRVPGAEQKARM